MRNNTKCFLCLINKDRDPTIDKGSISYQMIGLEKPYINLFFHRECYEKIPDIRKFLVENNDKILLLHDNML